jgi:hypothetical protein
MAHVVCVQKARNCIIGEAAETQLTRKTTNNHQRALDSMERTLLPSCDDTSCTSKLPKVIYTSKFNLILKPFCAFWNHKL